MYNFNHERWAMCCQASRFARVCYEDAFRYAHKRKTFGKFLIEHPVIRLKLAHMARFCYHGVYLTGVTGKLKPRIIGLKISLIK